MQWQIDDELILREAKESDIDAILEHVKVVHGTEIVPVSRLLLKHHPNLPISDHFIVVNESTRKVVAYLLLVRSTLVLEGTKFQAGHMEVVGTLPEYRHRGLIRELNKAFEQRASEYNLPLLLIIGIPYFYRQFGYEYAIPWGGGVPIRSEAIPPLKKGEEETVKFEKVTAETFPAFLNCWNKSNAHLDLHRHLTPRIYDFFSRGKLGDELGLEFNLVKGGDKIVGCFYFTVAWGNLEIRELSLENNQHLPSVLRFMKKRQKIFNLPLWIEKPAKPSLASYLVQFSGTPYSRPYAWYARIPSIIHFLQTIKPVIEERLANSEFHGLTDNLRINCFQEGYELGFKKGKLNKIKVINRKDLKDMHVRIPPLIIFQLLLGYHSLEELRDFYPDVRGDRQKFPLLSILFPKLRARIHPEI